jgi:hypothetical protein
VEGMKEALVKKDLPNKSTDVTRNQSFFNPLVQTKSKENKSFFNGKQDLKKQKKNLVSNLFNGNEDLDLDKVYNGDLFIGLGSFGKSVKLIQLALLAFNPDSLPIYGTDSKFGIETMMAVKFFQTINKLHVDGIVGNATIKLLDTCASKHIGTSINSLYHNLNNPKDNAYIASDIPHSLSPPISPVRVYAPENPGWIIVDPDYYKILKLALIFPLYFGPSYLEYRFLRKGEPKELPHLIN